jgi:YVTN family beta-propeller protein
MPLQTNYRSRLALFIPIAIASFAFWGISGFRPTVQGRDSASPVTPPAPFASPSALAICPDQRHALVTLATANAVALIDLEAGTVLQEIPVGQQPNGVALSADGNLAAVSCRIDGSIFLLGAGSGETDKSPWIQRGQVACGHLPADVVFSPQGDRLFVACAGSHEVVVLDITKPAEPKVSQRWKAWQEPRRLKLSPDGANLYVGCSRNATVHAFDTATGKEAWSRTLEAAFNMAGLALDPQTGELVTCQVFHRHHAMAKSNIEQGWALDNRLGRIFLKEPTSDPWQISLDVRGSAVGDPIAVALEGTGEWLAVAGGGTQEVLVFQRKAVQWSHGDPGDFLDSTLEYPTRKYERIAVGGRPAALAFLAGGKELAVANQLNDSVQLISTADKKVVKTISLARKQKPTEADQLVREGEALFFNAKKAHHHWFSCHTCHTDGHTSGQPFDTLNDDSYGNPKQTPTLLGVADTAPFTWHGWKHNMEKTVRDSLVNTLFGPEPSEREVKALTAYLLSLKPIPSPNKPSPGTAAAEALSRGRNLFYGKANCVRCHAGEALTTPKNHELPIEPDGSPFDTWNPPSLRGVHDRAPLMHHGLANDLKDLLQNHHKPEKMGGTALDKDEVDDLVEFLKSL